MKKNLFIVLAIVALAFIGCGGNDPTPETFTITFHANGGTPEPQAQTVEKDSKATEPTITKENYTLDGWYKETIFTTKWNFASDTVTTDIDLYAKWTLQRQYTITLLGKTVTVQDARTDETDSSLEDLDIMTKLRGAETLINESTTIDKVAWNRVLDKGLVIIIEIPATPYNNPNGYRASSDGKTMAFDIDFISDPETKNNTVAGRINLAITLYLDKGEELQ